MLATCYLLWDWVRSTTRFSHSSYEEQTTNKWWSSSALKCAFCTKFRAPTVGTNGQPMNDQPPREDRRRRLEETHLFRLNRFAFYYPTTINHIHNSLSTVIIIVGYFKLSGQFINWPSTHRPNTTSPNSQWSINMRALVKRVSCMEISPSHKRDDDGKTILKGTPRETGQKNH